MEPTAAGEVPDVQATAVRTAAEPGPAGFAGYVRLFSRAAFLQLFMSRVVSLIGTSAFRVALIWYVAGPLNAPGALGLVLAAFAAPQLFASLAGGVLGDRYNRKWVAVISDIASGLIFLAMWLLAIRGELGLALLVAMVILAGVSTAVYGPVTSAVLPLLVDRSELQRANSLQVIGGQGAFVIGPAIAGLAVGAVGVEVFFLLNAVSFFASAAVFLPARVPSSRATGGERSNPVREVREGLAVVVRTSWLRAGILAGALANLLVVAPAAVLVPAMIEHAALGSATLGGFMSAQAGGIVLGAAVAPYLVPRGGSSLATAFAGLGLAGLACFAFVLALGGWGIIVLGAVVGVGLALFDVLWDSHLQGHAPDAFLARVLAADAWVSFALRSLGLITASAIGVWIGFGRGLGVEAAIFVLLLALLSYLGLTRGSTDASAITLRRQSRG